MADNLNISPDIIDNLVNMLKNSNNSNNSDENMSFQNDSKVKEDLSGKMESNTSDNSVNFNNIDFETIMKIKSVIESLNTSNNQDSQLLYSLKPYLRKSRQKKIDQYINILKISQVSKLFNQKGDVD